MCAKFRRLENGFGNISKLSGNRRKPFRVRKTVGYKDNGHQIYETIGYYETYTIAFQALVEYNKNPFDLKNKDITLKELLNNWYDIEKEKLKPATLKTLRSAMNKLQPIEHMNFVDVKENHIYQVIDLIESVPTKKRVRTLFGSLYKFAKQKDLLVKDYSEFVFIKEDTTTIKKKKVPFTNEEIKMCFDNRGTQIYGLTSLLLFTGLRPIELIELKRENIHLDENYMIGGTKTKAGTNRTIPISRHIKAILEKLLDNDKPHLLYNNRNNKMTYKNLQEGMIKVFEHTPHECRHTFISNMDRTEANIGVVKKIVGHATTDVTEKVYTHKTMEELQEAMKLFDDYMETIIM